LYIDCTTIAFAMAVNPGSSTSGSRPSPWCCGSLQTGTIATGVAHLVCLLLLYLWIVQEVWQTRHFFTGVVLLSLVTFFLVVANVCLLGGAVRRYLKLNIFLRAGFKSH